MTTQATRAVRTRCATESRAVMAMKAGTAAIGSTMTKSELNANTAYSAIDITAHCWVWARFPQSVPALSVGAGPLEDPDERTD